MTLLAKISNKMRYERDKHRWKKNWQAVNNCSAWRNVATIDETMDMLLSTDCSMSRFGDGEYKVMVGGKNGFQKSDPELAVRLREVLLKCDTPGLLVCVPNVVKEMEIRSDAAKRFWQGFMADYGASWTSMLKQDGKYYNAHVTRLYMDYLKPELSKKWYERIQELWKEKDLLIVEGEKTRMGAGNDLLAGAKSIRRCICPSHSAFSEYDKILQTVRSIWKGELVLIALGQTATVLAYDLHSSGIRALDVGHIDIEYEWFLSGAAEKTAVAGKFVKEVDSQLIGADDTAYLAQIVARVGVK